VEVPAGEFAALIERAKRSDQAACTELYRRSVQPVYRYLAARVNSVDEAEELTQEVFLAALGGIEGLRAVDEPGVLAWLFQIARYKLADALRRRYRRPTAPLEEAELVADRRAGPEDVAQASAEREAVRQALEHLTPEQREVMLCKYVLDFDNERTARHVGKNVNAVNQLHHRALASLQRLLRAGERV
jgi:RNA polymerase sigma-70 factor (ECF subfamily)